MMAPEGRVPLGAGIAAAVFAQLYFGFLPAVPLWSVALLVAYLYHEPPRLVPPLPLAVVSPVDGTVLSLRQSDDPWLERQVLRIGIRPARLGISPLRSPTEGKVMGYRHGGNSQAGDAYVTPRGTAVSHALWIRTDENDDVVFVVSSRVRLHRLRFYLSVGERVGQGQRCGFVHFGSRVDVLLPAGSRREVEPGQTIVGGSGVLGRLLH